MIKRIKKALMLTIAIFLAINSINFSYAVGEDELHELESQVGTMIAVNPDTNEIYYAKNEDFIVPIASMSKLMTYLVIKDELTAGKFKITDKVKITKESAKYAAPGNAKMDLKEGELISIENLLNGMMVVSANDAAAALAIKSAGTEAAFAKKMNDKAAEIGLTNYLFVNASGLTDEHDKVTVVEREEKAANGKKEKKKLEVKSKELAFNKMSALSLMNLAKHIVVKYPEIEKYSKLEQLVMPDRNFIGDHTHGMYKSVPGLIGLKTGYTDEAKFNFTGYVDMEGYQPGQKFRLITVVTGAQTAKLRSKATKALIKYVNDNYKYADISGFESKRPITYYQSGKTIDTRFPLYLEKGIVGVYPKDAEVDIDYTVEKGKQPPFKDGQVLGQATIKYKGKKIGNINLINKGNKDEMDFLTRTLESVKDFIKKLMLII